MKDYGEHQGKPVHLHLDAPITAGTDPELSRLRAELKDVQAQLAQCRARLVEHASPGTSAPDVSDIAGLLHSMEGASPCWPQTCGGLLQSTADWNEAFRSQPAGPDDWSGGDAAYSIPLPDLNGVKRTLWIFGDSNIGPRTNCQSTADDLADGKASHCYISEESHPCTLWTLYGSTIAIQYHYPAEPPNHGQLDFYWGPGGAGPCLSPDAGRVWSEQWWVDAAKEEYHPGGWLPIFPPLRTASLPSIAAWPGHGIVIGDDLLVVNMPVQYIGFFAFVHLGMVATKIAGVSQPYTEWGTPQRLVRTATTATGAAIEKEEMTTWAYTPPIQKVIPFTKPGFLGYEPFEFSGLAQIFNAFVKWGLWFMHDPDPSVPNRVYIYGTKLSPSGGERLLVARADNIETVDDLLKFNWQFWDGQNWVDNHDNAVASLVQSNIELAPRLATGEFAVVPAPERASADQKWVLVHGFDKIQVATAPDPWGPFKAHFEYDLRECGYIPITDPRLPASAYAVKAHPHLSDDENLLVSFIVNPVIPGSVLEDNTTYVPRFLKLPWNTIFRGTCAAERSESDDQAVNYGASSRQYR